MLSRPLSDLQEQDFASLVTNAVPEGRDLEFKRDLPGGSDADIKEFLADVTSLANAQGGDLVYGIADSGGVATAVTGVSVADVDVALRRLESIIRDGIEPRLTVRMQWVPLASGRGVLVLRIPASLAAPHRVRFKNNGRFWNRNSRGKYEMDVHELRHAFTESEALPVRLRQFHDAAVSAAEGIDMPFVMKAEPTAVLSIIPLGLLRERRDLDLTSANAVRPVMETGILNWLPTLEGILSWSNDENTVKDYTLTHRTGRIDAAWTLGRTVEPGKSEHKLVWPKYFEDGVSDMATRGVARLQSYGIEGPWVFAVTVFGIKGAKLRSMSEASRPAWRDRARLPELVLEVVNEANLLPIYKAFWLLFGETRPLPLGSS